jgi:type III secretion protein T
MSPHSDLISVLLGMVKLPLAAFGLGVARCLGLLQILPISTRLGLRGMHRAGVAAALSMIVLPWLTAQLRPEDITGAHMVLLIGKEALIGFLLGVVFAAPFWAAETAGELIDQQRGSRGAVSPDPAGETESGITATLFVLTMTTIFFLSGGMHWLLDAIVQSYRTWPVGDLVPSLAPGAAMRLLGLLDSVLRAGLVLAAPLVMAMVLAELGLALISRFAPQLNVFDLSMSVKGLVQVFGLPVYTIFLIGYLRGGLAPLLHLQDELHVLSGQ